MKSFNNKRSTNKVLVLLLALLLACSNMAFSAHAPVHIANDSGLCALCVHSGGSDMVIPHVAGVVFIDSTQFSFIQSPAPHGFRSILHSIHQSRAPPELA